MKKLTDAEILAMARQIVANNSAPRERRKIDPKSIDARWKKVKHTCPKCGHTGPVNPDFGIRVVRGVERLQSWCADCRAHTNYYQSARKNRTVNNPSK